MKEIFANLLNQVGFAWWVEVKTEKPRCTYYFGPFLSENQAQAAKPGYVEDLEKEGAQGIVVVVKKCKPTTLTVADDLGGAFSQGVVSQFSGQLP